MIHRKRIAVFISPRPKRLKRHYPILEVRIVHTMLLFYRPNPPRFMFMFYPLKQNRISILSVETSAISSQQMVRRLSKGGSYISLLLSLNLQLRRRPDFMWQYLMTFPRIRMFFMSSVEDRLYLT